MFNFVLNTYNAMVVSDTTSSDGIPDGIAYGIDFHTEEFILGIIVGVIAVFIVKGIIKFAKFIADDNKKTKEWLDSKKSDE